MLADITHAVDNHDENADRVKHARRDERTDSHSEQHAELHRCDDDEEDPEQQRDVTKHRVVLPRRARLLIDREHLASEDARQRPADGDRAEPEQTVRHAQRRRLHKVSSRAVRHDADDRLQKYEREDNPSDHARPTLAALIGVGKHRERRAQRDTDEDVAGRLPPTVEEQRWPEDVAQQPRPH